MKNKTEITQVKYEYPWCKTLVTMINTKNMFSDVFKIEGNDLGFKDDIDDAYRSEARAKAYEKYNQAKIM